MDSGFGAFDTTFMDIGQQPQISSNTVPQRCLVALIDVNKLKVSLNQLQQAVGK